MAFDALHHLALDSFPVPHLALLPFFIAPWVLTFSPLYKISMYLDIFSIFPNKILPSLPPSSLLSFPCSFLSFLLLTLKDSAVF